MLESIIKESDVLRSAIKKRMKELGLGQIDLYVEATKLGRSDIRRQSINRYLKKNLKPGCLNEEQVIWIATYLGIPIQLVIGTSKKKITYQIPPYNKKKALEELKKYDKPENTQGTNS